MKVFDTEIPDVKIIEPTVYKDDRGYFFEAYNAQKFEELMGFCPNFCQSNESYSKKGTIRGLHLQKEPFAQAKLVRVIVGEIIDVVVDCRHGSSTNGENINTILSSENKRQLWVPRGFAHGFQVLSEFCILSYQVDTPYEASAEVSINPFDKDLHIHWPNLCNYILSDRDKDGISFSSFASVNGF
jgi:dTDP-4-dehydrorhamnose 3,5-epimerase